jgi:hypothetical protein
MQGDLFGEVPFAFPWPTDTVLVGEGDRVYVSGPFETTPAMLVTPTCTMAAQGKAVGSDDYAMATRALVPVRPLSELIERGALDPERHLDPMRADRMRPYFYLPENSSFGLAEESAALLYQPLSFHHDVVKDLRTAQLTGEGYWQLRRSLAFYAAGVRLNPDDLGPPPAPHDRTS